MRTKNKANIINVDNAMKLSNIHKERHVDYNHELWIVFVLKWWSDKYL